MSFMTFDLTNSPVPRLTRVDTVIAGRCIVYGYSIKESSGTATAELDMYNNPSQAAGPLIPVTLSAGQSTSDWWGPQGIEFDNGLFTVIAGAIAGSLYVALID